MTNHHKKYLTVWLPIYPAPPIINTCKTIHERDEKYPNAKTSIEYGHFEGDTIVGKARKSLDYKTPNEVIKEATGFESLLTFA